MTLSRSVHGHGKVRIRVCMGVHFSACTSVCVSTCVRGGTSVWTCVPCSVRVCVYIYRCVRVSMEGGRLHTSVCLFLHLRLCVSFRVCAPLPARVYSRAHQLIISPCNHSRPSSRSGARGAGGRLRPPGWAGLGADSLPQLFGARELPAAGWGRGRGRLSPGHPVPWRGGAALTLCERRLSLLA